MEIKRRIALLLVAALITTSSAVDVVPVYASQDGLTIGDGSSFEADAIVDEEESDSYEDQDVIVDEMQPVIVEDEALSDGAGTVIEDEKAAKDTAIKSEDEDEVANEGDGIIELGDFKYYIDDIHETATVVEWTGSGNAVIIDRFKLPDSYQTTRPQEDSHWRDVVAIGEGAFSETAEHKLTGVEIPDSVKRIEDNAFKNCTLLTSVELPSNMKISIEKFGKKGIIGNGAFAGCTSLNKVKLPSKLDDLGVKVFDGCLSLDSIKIPKDMDATVVWPDSDKKKETGPFTGATNLKNIEFEEEIKKICGGLFCGCDSIEKIKLPDTMTTLEDYAFKNCSNLESVTMTNAMTDIGASAFEACVSLKRIDLSPYLTTLGDKAFYACSSLCESTIPDSIDIVGKSAFSECASLSKVTFVEGDTSGYEGGNIDDSAFKHCVLLDSITVPNTFVRIGASAFTTCNSVSEMRIENRYPDKNFKMTITKSAFESCENLEKVTIDEGIHFEAIGIGEQAFYKCTKLERVVVDKNVELGSIGKNAFAACMGLKTVSMNEGVVFDSIGDSAFENCLQLEDISKLDQVKSIGARAFYNCSELAGIAMPDTVETIGEAAFADCSSLKDVVLSKGLKTVNAAAFRNDVSIVSINIPKSIERVNVQANNNYKDVYSKTVYDNDVEENDFKTYRGGIFRNCVALKDITFERDTIAIVDNILKGTNYVERITINDTVTQIGNNSFDGCYMLKRLMIPDSVISIGDEAFNNCYNIVNPEDPKARLIPNSVKTIGEGAFRKCSSLSRIILPDGFEVLGKEAFKGSTVSQAYLPDSTLSIGISCFEGCEKLAEVHLPKDLVSVPDGIFQDCVALSKVNLSKDKLETIGKSAFKNCDSLVTFNSTNAIDFTGFKVLNEIKERAFQDCDKLTAVKLSAATTVLGDYVFDDCNLLSDISIGTGLTTIPTGAFSNLGSLRMMTIPRNVTTIKTGAFLKDPNLEEIHIPKTTKTIEPGVFSYFDHLTVWVVEGSPAHEYVIKYGIKWHPDFVPVTSINYIEEQIEINVGESVQPVIEIYPVNYSVDIAYDVSDISVLSVDSAGKVKGLAAGKAWLIASASCNEAGDKVNDTVEIKVRVPVEGVTLDKTTLSLGIGDHETLVATVKPENADDKRVKWSSNDETVAYVDQNGVVYAKKKGTAVITATTIDKGKTATCTVTVASDFLDAPPSWTKELNAPVADPVSSNVLRGTHVSLTCEAAGAQIYYTTDGNIPAADYTGKMSSSTRLYEGPITITKNTTLRAFAICPGYKYSPDAVYYYTVGDSWGDVDASLRGLFDNDATKVPTGLWYAFAGDNKYYRTPGVISLSREYTGSEIMFDSVYIYDGMNRLVETRDYTLAYKNNTDAADASTEKAPSVSIKGKGNYSKTATFNFTIAKARMSLISVKSGTTMTITEGVSLSTLKPELIYNSITLKENKDYALSYYKGSVSAANLVTASTKAEKGTYIITIAACADGNFTGTSTKQINVKVIDKDSATKIPMSKVTVAAIESAWSQSGVNLNQLFSVSGASVKYGDDNLVYGKDYTVDEVDTVLYPGYPSKGEYTFIIHGTEASAEKSYVGDKVCTLKIEGIDASKVKYKCLNKKPLYTGSVITLEDLFAADSTSCNEVTLYTDAGTLTRGVDYDVDMSQSVVYGKFSVTFNLKGKYSGSILVKNIKVKPRPISEEMVTVKAAKYSRAGAVPDVSVTYKGKMLKEGIDYTLSYRKNKKISTSASTQPSVTVKGKGCFKGSVSKTFALNKAPISGLSLVVADQKYKEGKAISYYLKKPKLQDNGKTVSTKDVIKPSKSDYKYYNALTGEEFAETFVPTAGTIIEVKVTVAAKETGGYSGGSAELIGTYRIIDSAKFINNAKVTITPSAFAGGDEVVPLKKTDVTVTLKDGTTLDPKYYEIVSITNNCLKGTAKVVIAGREEYGGTKKATFKINAKIIE